MLSHLRQIGCRASGNLVKRIIHCDGFVSDSRTLFTSRGHMSAADEKTPNLLQSEKENMIREIENHIEKLQTLKANLHGSIPHTPEPAPTKPAKRIVLQVPKGTRDFNPQQMALRQMILDKITKVFQKYGAEAIDTPVFEHRDVLVKEYNDDAKLIYHLEDQSGQPLSLRYDLTVPFARYLAMNKITTTKCYHFGKVYRRDDPIAWQGRYREFDQCDFDIAGVFDPMLPDAECLKVLSDILHALDVGPFVIRLNHRQLLDGIFEVCGIPAEKVRSVCSAVDKMDKPGWTEVRKELINEKGLSEATADRIGEYIQLNGSTELVDKLLENEHLNNVPSAKQGLDALKLLLHYCNILELNQELIVDLSLARGMDYYTGVIYEAVLKSDKKCDIGSIAGGGRYDNLVGSYDPKKKCVPCVGVSIGVGRIFSLLEAKLQPNQFRTNCADVFVASTHRGLYDRRLNLVAQLWKAGIRAEHSYKLNPKILNQLQHCEEYNIPLAVLIGEDEFSRNAVLIRDVSSREEKEIPMDSLITEINKRIGSN